jgi:iron complex transport system substrate-binding protein
MSEKILLAGGINAIQDLKNRPFPELSREYILKLNPDVILGGTFQKMDSTFFSKYPELKQITAYQKRQIYPLKDDLATRPSPRIIQSIIEIKEALGRVK